MLKGQKATLFREQPLARLLLRTSLLGGVSRNCRGGKLSHHRSIEGNRFRHDGCFTIREFTELDGGRIVLGKNHASLHSSGRSGQLVRLGRDRNCSVSGNSVRPCLVSHRVSRFRSGRNGLDIADNHNVNVAAPVDRKLTARLIQALDNESRASRRKVPIRVVEQRRATAATNRTTNPHEAVVRRVKLVPRGFQHENRTRLRSVKNLIQRHEIGLGSLATALAEKRLRERTNRGAIDLRHGDIQLS